MPYCEHCGKEIVSPDKFCNECGSKIPKKIRKQLEKFVDELVLVLDESGSMAGKEGEVKESVNAFINSQKDLGEAYITIYGFSDGYRTIIPRTNIKKVGAFTDYKISGWTALLDAIGKTLISTKEVVDKDNIHKVIIGIITDGEENRSKEFTRENIKSLVKAREADGWKIDYMMNDVSQERTDQLASLYSIKSAHGGLKYRSLMGEFSTRACAYRKND